MSESRQLAAIVFTDIAGYSQAMGNDETYALELLKKNRSITPKVIEQFDGEFLKEMGDGTLSRFSSVIDAVRCAIEIQKQAKEADLPLRIGIHIGDVIIEDSDVLGSGVNIASRIEPLADVGGICISSDVWHQISNQKDLSTQSLGVKNLKGVNEPVEIFRLNLESTVKKENSETQDENLSLVTNLIDRKFPHIVTLYGFFCWGMVSVIRYIVDLYMLSPHLISLTIFGAASFLPTIFILAYFRGKKGFKDFEKIEKIGIPVNLVASVLFLSLMFSSRDLGSVTRVVTLEDEEGKMLERVIPKADFIKKITVFPFDSEFADKENTWMSVALTNGIGLCLSQDPFVEKGGVSNDDLRESGYSDLVGVPFSLKQKLANEAMLDMFATGLLTKEDNHITINIQLYDTASGKLISEHLYTSDSFLNLVDDITAQLRFDIGLPEKHIQESKFLSIRDILTSSEEAFILYSKGIYKLYVEAQAAESLDYFKSSFQIDKTNASVAGLIGLCYIILNENEKSTQYYNAALKHIYKVSDSEATDIKLQYYELYKKDPDKASKLIKMRAELSPQNKEARLALAYEYVSKSLWGDALKEFNYIYQIYPNEHGMLAHISQVYMNKRDFNNAISYAKKAENLLPESKDRFSFTAYIYKSFHYFDKAIESYERALMMAPNNISIMHRLSDIKRDMGNFDDALELCNEILSLSSIQEDYIEAYGCFQSYYYHRGQIKKAMEILDKKIEKHKERDIGGINSLLAEGTRIPLYIDIGKFEKARKLIEYVKTQSIDLLKGWAINYYVYLGIKTDNIDMLTKVIEDINLHIEETAQEYLRDGMHISQGKIFEIQGEYELALNEYIKMIKKEDYEEDNWIALEYISHCNLLLNNYKDAREYINMAIEMFPYGPSLRYESALIYERAGQMDKALEEMQIALDIWKDADDDNVDANKAKAKWVEWNATAN